MEPTYAGELFQLAFFIMCLCGILSGCAVVEKVVERFDHWRSMRRFEARLHDRRR